MKKYILILSAALCAAIAVSCSKTADEGKDTPPTPGKGILNPVSLTFETPITKVAIDEEGIARWEEGDQVKIICFNAEGDVWTSDPVTVVNGKITATVEDADIYYAVYPASAEISLEQVEGVDNLKVTIAKKQDGTFKNACYYAAKTTKTAKTFNFKAISGILKFEADHDYVRVDIRDVEKATARYDFAGTEICTFDDAGNVTVKPVDQNNSIITVDLNQSGIYYAAIVGNAVNEAAFRFTKDTTLNYEPGVFYNNLITYTPAKIKNFGKLTDKIVKEVYVSPEGSGEKTGLSAADAAPESDLVEACLGDEKVSYTAVKGLLHTYTGVWNCFRRDGLTIHFAEGEYSSAFTVAGNNSSFELTLQGDKGAVLTGANTVKANRLPSESGKGTSTTIKDFTIKNTLTSEAGICNLENCTFTTSGKTGLSVTKGICNLENCNFIECTTTSGNGAALVMDVTAQVTAQKCNFTSNEATNGAAVCLNNGTASSDDFVIFSAEDCIFNNNKASGSGGAILIGQTAYNGQIRFNNCRFDGNQATGTSSHGAVFYCNSTSASTNAPAAFFNGCTFINSQGAFKTPSTITTGFGYSIFGNTGSRVALNNCTLKAMNSKSSGDTYNYATNGSEVALTGSSVIANTCIWGSGVTGQRALASIGRKASGSIDAVHSTIVNSVIQHKSDKRSALFLSSGWYLKMWGSIFANLNTNKTAVDGKDYVFGNCFDRGLANSTLPGAKGMDDATKGDTGITHSYYTYTFNASTWTDFTPMTKAEVQDKVKNTPNIGELFDAWLTEIGAYDVDIMGRTRTATAMSPGSYNLTWSN